MADYNSWGQSSRGLLNDFSLQSYGGEAAPLSTRGHSHVPSEVEFSEIDLGSDSPLSQSAKVQTKCVSICTSGSTSRPKCDRMTHVCLGTPHNLHQHLVPLAVADCLWHLQVAAASKCNFFTTVSCHPQVKLPIFNDYVAPASKTPIRVPLDSVAAPGFSGEGNTCRAVIVRTDGPVPAKVCRAPAFSSC